MAKATVEKLGASAEALKQEHRRELHQLLELLRSELAQLSENDAEAAQSMAGFAQVAAHEATRTQHHPRLLELAVEGLNASVEGFDTSHPRLAQIVATLISLLTNLRI